MVHDDHNHHEHDDDHDHGHHHHDVGDPGVAVLTASSSRTLTNDRAGEAIEAALEGEGYSVVEREVVTDEYDAIESRVEGYTEQPSIDAVVTTGGTGVTPDDVTIEAVSGLFTKELPGFGELFRRLSYEEIGTQVIGTRATAGVVAGTLVFCLPGGEHAARLGAEQIIVHELPHLVGLAQRGTDE